MGDIDTGIDISAGPEVSTGPKVSTGPEVSTGPKVSAGPEVSENIIGVVATTGEVIGSNLKSRLPTIIVGSLTLIASIAWNNGIKALIDQYIPPEYSKSGNVRVKFIYAFLLTIGIIIIIGILVNYIG